MAYTFTEKTHMRILISTLVLFLSLGVSAQDGPRHLRLGFGPSHSTGLFAGYYFVADATFPLGRALAIGPTVSAYYSGNASFVSFSQGRAGTSFGTALGGPARDSEFRRQEAMLGGLLWFDPLALRRDRVSRHHLWLGAGVGYRFLTHTTVFYERTNNDVDLQFATVKSYGEFAPVFGRLLYEYDLGERTSTGFGVSMEGSDGEAVLATTLQFGVRF
jgi:hypothetical protein